MILNEIVVDEPVYSVKGKIMVDLHKYQVRLILTNIKQIKGLGTHDAEKLIGNELSSDHKYTLKIMLKADEPLPANDIRVRAKGLRFFDEHINIEVNKRPLSELLALDYVEIIPHSWPPKYQIKNKDAVLELLARGKF